MSHFSCLVVGEDVDAALLPFLESFEVEPYREYLDPTEIASMAEEYGLPASDLAGLALEMEDWRDNEGGVEDGRLYCWSTSNPNRRFDWWQLADETAKRLQLLAPKTIESVNQARKRDVRAEHLRADPPFALLVDGQWYECPELPNSLEYDWATWKPRFAQLFDAISNDALLTIVDYHA